ncbi:hypothetical protein FKP32DRAFT_1757273 [Trametes sanguinea]|nr:hypothetical protein FKP32DRAFT_1757273 [Trametes sanguinea]
MNSKCSYAHRFYTFAQETLTADFKTAVNGIFTPCNSAAQPPSTLSRPPSARLAPILGGTIGGVAVAFVTVSTVLLVLRRKKTRQGPVLLDLFKEHSESDALGSGQESMSASVITPFTLDAHSGSGNDGGKAGRSEELVHPPGRNRRSRTDAHQPPASSPTHHPQPPVAHESDRHDDAGPLPMLERSASGRLPPAYRSSWEPSGPPITVIAIPRPLPTPVKAPPRS